MDIARWDPIRKIRRWDPLRDLEAMSERLSRMVGRGLTTRLPLRKGLTLLCLGNMLDILFGQIHGGS